MKLTDRQKQRQVDRIYTLFFDEVEAGDGEDVPEGKLKVQMLPDIQAIFHESIPAGEALEMSVLETLLNDMVFKITDHICQQDPLIHRNFCIQIVAYIVSDFISESISQVAIPESSDVDDDNPMFS